MKNYLAAQRYAKALSDSLPELEQLEPASEWLQGFATLLAENAEFRLVLQNPAVPAAARHAVLEDILAKTSAEPVLRNLASELFRRGRLNIVTEIAELFGRIVDARLSRITARVTTAEPVTDQQAERIRAGLATYANKDVSLKKRVDPDIIGGVVVKIDGIVIDGSLRARLKQLRTALLSEENGTV